MHLFALEDLCGIANLPCARWCRNRLQPGRFPPLLSLMGRLFSGRWKSNLGLEPGNIIAVNLFILSIGIAGVELVRPAAALHILQVILSGAMITLTPGFNGHVAHGKAPVHGQVFDGGTGELHGPVQRPVHPISPMVCRIKSLPPTRASSPSNSNLRDSGTLSQVSPRAMAAARSVLPTPVEERPAPVSAGMRICSDDQVSRPPRVPARAGGSARSPGGPLQSNSANRTFAELPEDLGLLCGLMSLLGVK